MPTRPADRDEAGLRRLEGEPSSAFRSAAPGRDMTEMTLSSLTRDEAQERADLLTVDRYDIDVDFTGLLEGDAFRATSTMRFRCRTEGASTLVDCAAEVESASLNGQPLAADAVTGDRIRLDGLAADNVLVIESVQRSTDQGTGVHRSVDPSDGEVYVWTSFEPDDARRVWACFDQPDLKAPVAFTAAAPATWTVVSSSGDPSAIEDGDGVRRWTFPDTPALSTYVPVINAGPFHEVRSERDGYDLGLYARQSLATFLDRDAEELFGLTAAGLAFFGERFDMPFPQRRYDQVFVPDLGGAMENWGCVTWSDVFVYRTEASPAERQMRAAVLLHEMAHMWFGDLVTMRWWDDLWLNESFATFMSVLCQTQATRWRGAWTTFANVEKTWAYRQDQLPSTHPIVADINDLEDVEVNFDGITYAKGASVLKQLVAWVGIDGFMEGLRQYFKDHAYANAEFVDLLTALEKASGRELDAWAKEWLQTSGVNTLSPEFELAEDGSYTSFGVRQT